MLIRLLALAALFATAASGQMMPRQQAGPVTGFQTNAPATGGQLGLQQQQIPITTGINLAGLGGGQPVLPQNFQQPMAGQLTQPVLTSQQAAQLLPMDQLQQQLNTRVAGFGQMQQVGVQGINTLGLQQQQPIVGQFGGIQQQPIVGQYGLGFGGVQQPIGVNTLGLQQQPIFGQFGGIQQQPIYGYQQPIVGQFGGVQQQPIMGQFGAVQQPIGGLGFGGVQQQPILGQFGAPMMV